MELEAQSEIGTLIDCYRYSSHVNSMYEVGDTCDLHDYAYGGTLRGLTHLWKQSILRGRQVMSNTNSLTEKCEMSTTCKHRISWWWAWNVLKFHAHQHDMCHAHFTSRTSNAKRTWEKTTVS